MHHWPADHVERWPLERLVPYARNARTHSATQLAQLAASMREWGWTNPVLVDEAGTIIAGHGRVEAARTLGLTEAPVMIARGWSEPKKQAYVIADNKLALNAGWNEELLAAELSDLEAHAFDLNLLGFDASELSRLLGGIEGVEGEDDVPEVPGTPVSRAGDLWLLGGHRLLASTCTGRGEKLSPERRHRDRVRKLIEHLRGGSRCPRSWCARRETPSAPDGDQGRRALLPGRSCARLRRQ